MNDSNHSDPDLSLVGSVLYWCKLVIVSSSRRVYKKISLCTVHMRLVSAEYTGLATVLKLRVNT